MIKKKRLELISDIINDNVVSTQEDLMDILKKSGYEVTQATISRDIKELHLVKTTINGKYRYSTGNKRDKVIDVSFKFHVIFKESVINIRYAGNMVVIKCYLGMAPAACATLDTIVWDGVVGTLAGDDTIFIVTKNEYCSKELTEELNKFLET
ncbi:MAG: arginine repressor [Oscillospiraceae bacterium]